MEVWGFGKKGEGMVASHIVIMGSIYNHPLVGNKYINTNHLYTTYIHIAV